MHKLKPMNKLVVIFVHLSAIDTQNVKETLWFIATAEKLLAMFNENMY